MSPSTPFDRREPIPGYRTVDLLGRGGYGEVWRAIAPGGIPKAVKIVFGDGDSSQAAAEMRALTRVKDVRHPLLLSIERIEITHGNLVLVTELADCSLKQQFQRYRDEQSTGVPQEELLQYLGDTAEALDFLYERYSLQHLDVKPENILLIGGRAKVGDFGLVKNLYERGASIIGGLTPTYAPPELFEGKPTRHSDQYSLAIVYMQMLTGLLPFLADNMAQLATLHLRGVPDLSALPKPQRTVIARALSKDPAQRFESCVAMVKALREAARDVRASDPARLEQTASTGAEHTAPIAPLAKRTDVTSRLGTEAGTPHPSAPAPIAELASDADAPAQGTEKARRTGAPMILVGIGGAGVEVLAKLVRRFNDRFGRAEQWPDVELLVLDVNTKILTSQFHEDDLARVTIVPIPLKPAESYGAQGTDYVKWLGRRWFYNIPRDLSSAAYRPLGRLALMTNAAKVKSAVSTVIGRAAGGITDKTPHAKPSPRVVLIGAVSGGTAGGAMLDLAYALRGELKRRGLSDENVHSLLLHATPRSAADRDRARANAYSTMCELHHFSQPGSCYPGEPLLGTPPFHGDNATFARTHLLRLGDGLGNTEWDLATDQIAEFLFGSIVTPAQRLLEAGEANEAAARGTGGSLSIQPCDVLALGAGINPIIEQAVRIACNDVIALWRDGRTPDPGADVATLPDRTVKMNSFASYAPPRSKKVEEAVRKQLAECRLDFASFLADATEVLKLEVGGDVPDLVEKLVDQSLGATRADFDRDERVEAVLEMIDQFLLCEAVPGIDQPEDQLYAQLIGRLGTQTRGRVAPFLDGIRQLVDASDVRIEGARLYATTAKTLLQSLQESALTQAGELRERALALALEVRGHEAGKGERSRFAWPLRKKDPDDRLRGVLKPYTETRVNEVLRRAVAKIVRIMDAEISTMIEQLDRLARDLSLLAEPVRHGGVDRHEEDEPTGSASVAALVAYQQLMQTQLGLRRGDIARAIEDVMEQRVFQGNDGLRRFLVPEAELRKQLWRPLAEAARHAVLACIRQINCRMIEKCGEGGGDGDLVSLLGRSGSDKSRAAARRVLIVPDDVEPTQLRSRLAAALPDATVVRGRKCDVALWSLGNHIPLERAANDLIAGIELYKDLAERLHTRIDIAWRPCVEAEVPARRDVESAAPVCTPTAMIPA